MCLSRRLRRICTNIMSEIMVEMSARALRIVIMMIPQGLRKLSDGVVSFVCMIVIVELSLESYNRMFSLEKTLYWMDFEL